jgi:hypothetical protein
VFYAVYLGTRRFVFVYVLAQLSPHVVLAVRLTLWQWSHWVGLCLVAVGCCYAD